MVAPDTATTSDLATRDQSKIHSFAKHFNIQFQNLESFDLLRLAGKVKDQWFSQSLCEVNGSVVRMGVVQGTYHWHKHENNDQFFFCLDGEFSIDIDDRAIALKSYQGVVIPKGQIHRPRAAERCLILIIENRQI